ncbi:MAG TPA: CHRD domain-containing protein [Dehalococcoidia bacterium]|nr:CHRD domain-containing protein [Dehalococcoidia bacterium]
MKRLLAALFAAAVVVGVAGLALRDGTAQAAQFTIEGVATGAEEVPPVTGPGSVRVRFVFDDVAKTLQFQATVNGIDQGQVTAAHIHRAPRGTNGPIVHNLSTVPFVTVHGTLTLSDADIADLRAGNFYFNAHSRDNPGGFARFQLTLPAAAQPAATPSALPRTGSGGMLDEAGFGWLPFAVLTLLGVSGLGALALAARRS